MLDECKGERLEDVLFAFSAAVLKKVIEEEVATSGEYPAVALNLALEERGYQRDNTDLAYVGLAHKAALRSLLEKKTKARDQFRSVVELLDAKEKEVAQRREEIQAKEQDTSGKTLSQDVKLEMRRALRNNWTGNELWLETLLTGDADHRKDSLINMPFDKVWRRIEQGRLDELEESSGGLLQQLEGRLKVQQERLQKWEGFKKKMCEDRPMPSPSKQKAAQNTTRGIDLGFVSHEALQIGRISPRKLTLRKETPEPEVELNDEYKELVRGLEEELSYSNPKRSSALAFLSKPRVPNYNAEIDSSFTDHNEDVVSELSETEDFPDLSPQEEQKSEQEPEPEPEPEQEEESVSSFQAKLEQARRGPVRPRISHTIDSYPPAAASFKARASRKSISEAAASDKTASNHTSPIPSVRGRRSSSVKPPKPPKPENLSAPELPRPASPTQEEADQILESISKASPSPTKRPKPRHTLSLADRTRLSLNRKPSLFLDDEEPPELPPPVNTNIPMTSSPTDLSPTTITPSPVEEELEDLTARTQKSMAGYDKARQKAQLERRRSLRPKPPPKKESLSSYFPNADDPERSMLAEELMTEQDMEAVFKSRPKIKESPILSPVRMTWDPVEYQ